MGVKVVVGPDNATVEAGRTVGQLRDAFAQAYSLAADATASIDGFRADDSAVPSDGQTLVFNQPTGSKG